MNSSGSSLYTRSSSLILFARFYGSPLELTDRRLKESLSAQGNCERALDGVTPFRNFIPQFTDEDYAQNFSVEWEKHRDILTSRPPIPQKVCGGNPLAGTLYWLDGAGGRVQSGRVHALPSRAGRDGDLGRPVVQCGSGPGR